MQLSGDILIECSFLLIDTKGKPEEAPVSSNNITSITLIISETMIAALASSPIANDLARALSHAEKNTRLAYKGMTDRILEILGLPNSVGASATLEYCGLTGEPEPASCLRADPVHLITNHDHLAMSDPANLKLDHAEAEVFVSEILAQLAENSWQLHAPKPGAWYLTTNETIDMKTFPVRDVIGKNIYDYLPVGPDALRWQKLQIEIQGVLHTSEVNKKREQAGKLPINSLWFWGAGPQESIDNPDPRPGWFLWGNHYLLRGLEVTKNIIRKNLPTDAVSWIDELETGKHLVVIDEHEKDMNIDNATNIIKSSLGALKAGKINTLQLAASNGPMYTITRPGVLHNLTHFWRIPKNLASYF